MGINWNAPHGTTPPHGIPPPQSSMYEVYRLTALIRDKYTVEELRKLCADEDAVKKLSRNACTQTRLVVCFEKATNKPL